MLDLNWCSIGHLESQPILSGEDMYKRQSFTGGMMGLLLAMCPLALQSAALPGGYRDLPWGTGIQVANERLVSQGVAARLIQNDDFGTNGFDQQCIAATNNDDADRPSTTTLWFFDDHLVSYVTGFSSLHDGLSKKLMKLMKKKYGPYASDNVDESEGQKKWWKATWRNADTQVVFYYVTDDEFAQIDPDNSDSMISITYSSKHFNRLKASADEKAARQKRINENGEEQNKLKKYNQDL